MATFIICYVVFLTILLLVLYFVQINKFIKWQIGELIAENCELWLYFVALSLPVDGTKYHEVLLILLSALNYFKIGINYLSRI